MTQKDRMSALMDVRLSIKACMQANPHDKLRCDGELFTAKNLISHCQEKPLLREVVPVPQTDTGR